MSGQDDNIGEYRTLQPSPRVLAQQLGEAYAFTAWQPQKPAAASEAERQPALSERSSRAAAGQPAAARPKLEQQAHEQLSAEGVPGFLRIVPTIRDVMVRIWLGELAAGQATG